MDPRFYKTEEIVSLRSALRKNSLAKSRPLFIFACGGDRKHYPTRTMLSRFISTCGLPELKDVFCVLAENVADEEEFKGVDLLTQEAMIADISDVIILFCESWGSICELGAFSALPSVCDILALAVDKSHKNDQSFIVRGPVEKVDNASDSESISRVFYLGLDMPLGSKEFVDYVRKVRSLVSSHDNRKKVNQDATKIVVGSLALELIDLVVAFAPITLGDLLDIYCSVKEFDIDEMRIFSPTIEDSMKSASDISFESVVAFMRATGMIRRTYVSPDGCRRDDVYVPEIVPEAPFLFKKNVPGLDQIKAKVLIRKRRQGIKGAKDVYRRFDC